MNTITMTFSDNTFSLWWFLIPIIGILIGLVVAFGMDNEIGMYLLLSSAFIFTILLLTSATLEDDLENNRNPTTAEVAQKFHLTPIPDTKSNFIDNNGTRYGECVAKTTQTSPTSVSAKLFCVKDGQAVAVPAPK